MPGTVYLIIVGITAISASGKICHYTIFTFILQQMDMFFLGHEYVFT